MPLTWLPRINMKTIVYKAWLGTGAGGVVGNQRFTSVTEDGVKCSSCAGVTLPRNKMTLICSSVLNV